jgi:hypothetical protein
MKSALQENNLLGVGLQVLENVSPAQVVVSRSYLVLVGVSDASLARPVMNELAVMVPVLVRAKRVPREHTKLKQENGIQFANLARHAMPATTGKAAAEMEPPSCTALLTVLHAKGMSAAKIVRSLVR